MNAEDAAPYLKLAAQLSIKTADKKWMLNVLSTLTDTQHHFFAKDYVGPKRKQIVQDLVINNDDGFFTGLPETKSKSKSNSCSMMVMSKL